MIEEYFKLLETLNEEQKSALSGYSDAEILKLESLYKVSITGELQAFLKKIGRCDGGLVGDNPFLFYREIMNVRSHILLQVYLINELQEMGAYDQIKNPFIVAVEYETQFMYLQTKRGDGIVYCFDENNQIVESTGLTFSEYCLKVYDRYIRHGSNPNRRFDVICKGEMLVI